ncbi:MAG: hypothetical protein WC761_00360 [Candidatus Paceibacterota bacterium]|jgi:hypothetical protein
MKTYLCALVTFIFLTACEVKSHTSYTFPSDAGSTPMVLVAECSESFVCVSPWVHWACIIPNASFFSDDFCAREDITSEDIQSYCLEACFRAGGMCEAPDPESPMPVVAVCSL